MAQGQGDGWWVLSSCPLTSATLCCGLRRLVQQAVEHVCSGLLHYRATHALPDNEAPQFRAATKVALDVMLQFLAACFARVYQGTQANA